MRFRTTIARLAGAALVAALFISVVASAEETKALKDEQQIKLLRLQRDLNFARAQQAYIKAEYEELQKKALQTLLRFQQEATRAEEKQKEYDAFLKTLERKGWTLDAEKGVYVKDEKSTP